MPQVLLFDLGGVLVEYTGQQDIRQYLVEPLSEPEIASRFNTPVGNAFQTGQVSAQEFADFVVSSWPLSLTAEEFLVEFATWSRALYPGATELLAALRPHYRLAALSNTNEVHWRRNVDVLGVDSLFERCFASHEMGAAKPDVAAYRFVLDALDVAPADVVFFDDHVGNVEAARQLGIDAHQVVGVDSLRRCLKEIGLLEA